MVRAYDGDFMDDEEEIMAVVPKSLLEIKPGDKLDDFYTFLETPKVEGDVIAAKVVWFDGGESVREWELSEGAEHLKLDITTQEE